MFVTSWSNITEGHTRSNATGGSDRLKFIKTTLRILLNSVGKTAIKAF